MFKKFWNAGNSENPTAVVWDKQKNAQSLSFSDDGSTVCWTQDLKLVWIPVHTTAKLSGGIFTLDFQIDAIANRQIGVGFLLDPPDWGFFGYLGAGRNAWSYDAFEGAIVTETAATHAGLPKIQDSGTVTMRLDLKEKNECVFIVNRTETPAISLPVGAMALPAACLLKRGQKITLANFRQLG